MSGLFQGYQSNPNIREQAQIDSFGNLQRVFTGSTPSSSVQARLLPGMSNLPFGYIVGQDNLPVVASRNLDNNEPRFDLPEFMTTDYGQYESDHDIPALEAGSSEITQKSIEAPQQSGNDQTISVESPGVRQQPIQRATEQVVSPTTHRPAQTPPRVKQHTGTPHPRVPVQTPASNTTASKSLVQQSSRAETEPSNPDDEKVWGRLQNIFNRHQAKTEEPASAESEAEIEPQITPPYLSEGSDQNTSLSVESEKTKITSETQPSQLKPQFDQTKQEAVKPQTVQSNHEAVKSQTVQTKQETVKPQSQTQNDISSEKAPLIATQQKTEHHSPLPENAHHSDSDHTEIIQKTMVDPPKSPPPLETIWPVQRREIKTAARNTPILDGGYAQTGGFQNHAAELHSILSSVESGKPTGSKIEVIPPRHPRSFVEAKAKPRVSSPPAVQTDQIEEPFDVIGMSPSIEAESGTEPPSISPMTQPPRVQRSLDRETKNRFVPTEIGDLPEDLWPLINEPVPQQIASPDTNHIASGDANDRLLPSPAPETSSTQSAVQRTAAQSIAGAITQPPVARQAEGTQDGQTQDTQVESQSSSSPPEENTSATSPPAAQAPVDTDELARKVYSELKRKLMVEWERIRNR